MRLQDYLNFDVYLTSLQISGFIHQSVKNSRSRGIIIGLSGGIDSACVCGLAVNALGPNRVFALLLPEQDSDPKSERDAIIVAKHYGIRTKTIDITPTLESFEIYDILPKNTFSHRERAAKLLKIGYSLFPKSHSPYIGGLKGTRFPFQRRIQAYYRIKHRIRMVHLYYYAEQLNYLVAGTANRTEHLTGFFVKYGDSAADIMPILNLYKTQVRKLSAFVGVPKQIIDKPSIPDLIPGIEDESVLGMSYEKLDLILIGIVNGVDTREIIKQTEVSGRVITYVKNIIALSESLRQPPGAPSA